MKGYQNHKSNVMNLYTSRLVRSCLFLLTCAITLSVSSETACARNGKIAGTINSSQTGDALIDANVVIENTFLGAASDITGKYFILNVPSGTYNVTASLVGYTGQKITDVEVNSNQTTYLDFSLAPSVIQMEEVVVTWKKPPVDLKETSSRSVMRQEVLEKLPVENVAQMLQLQAGTSTDASGELHLRGGRSGEIVYYVDGQRVENPITGASSIFINREAIQELTLLSGTFNAEYGDAWQEFTIFVPLIRIREKMIRLENLADDRPALVYSYQIHII